MGGDEQGEAVVGLPVRVVEGLRHAFAYLHDGEEGRMVGVAFWREADAVAERGIVTIGSIELLSIDFQGIYA